MELKKIEGFTPGPWKVYNEPYKLKGGHELIETLIVTQYDHPQLKEPAQITTKWLGMGENDKPKTSIGIRPEDAELLAYAPELYKLAGQYRDECERLKGLLEKQYINWWRDHGKERLSESLQQFKTDNNL